MKKEIHDGIPQNLYTSNNERMIHLVMKKILGSI